MIKPELSTRTRRSLGHGSSATDMRLCSLMSPRGAASPRLCGDLAEPQQRQREEQGADQRDREELRPDHVEARAAIQDRLGERHEMRRGRRLHDRRAATCGMLSSGVLLPDSMFIGMATSMKSNPSCGIERATVPRKMPIAVAKNR